MAGEAFLTALAVNSNVASPTQNQAPNAMALLYGQILRKGFGLLVGVQRARKPARRPIVFIRDEALILTFYRREKEPPALPKSYCPTFVAYESNDST